VPVEDRDFGAGNACRLQQHSVVGPATLMVRRLARTTGLETRMPSMS
jgi:hypothetical protein